MIGGSFLSAFFINNWWERSGGSMKYTGKGNYFGGSGGGMGAFKPPYADSCEAGSTYANRVTDIETNQAKKILTELQRDKTSGGIVSKKSV